MTAIGLIVWHSRMPQDRGFCLCGLHKLWSCWRPEASQLSASPKASKRSSFNLWPQSLRLVLDSAPAPCASIFTAQEWDFQNFYVQIIPTSTVQLWIYYVIQLENSTAPRQHQPEAVKGRRPWQGTANWLFDITTSCEISGPKSWQVIKAELASSRKQSFICALSLVSFLSYDKLHWRKTYLQIWEPQFGFAITPELFHK